MDAVSEALTTMAEQLAVLSKAAEELSHRELIGLLTELTTLVRRVPALEHQILARLTDETEPHRLGETTWKKVLTTALRVTPADAGRRLKRAATLGPRRAMTGEPLPPLWEATAAAQAAGLLDEEHLAVIAQFHNRLPATVDVATRAEADRHLAQVAAGLDPHNLDEAAATLLVVIDPDGAEPKDQQVARKRGLTVSKQQPDGTATISGTLSPEALAIWQAIFAKEAALGANQPEDPADVGDSGRDLRTQAQRNHDAFVTVGRRALESGELGSHNGLPVTVIVSTTLQELQKSAGVAVTGGGSLLPMPDLIRMAARAHHYLYVYDGHTGQSLYLGRAKRLASMAQRIVLHARDRGCTRPGCSAPGYWCQVHHITDWKDGGQTDIDDLTLACPSDHRMLDRTDWRTTKDSKNRTEWRPPPDLDRGRHRVNGYHHPERYLLRQDEDDEP
ncbi:HNH endonuclease signature motif containing protein [Mycolicibacterium vaccae]|uniref:HNH endonuclease signature motif containing protein n=1 Tax=Mycolicibacterium vaccae TaxID=1810 RepID=UPI003CF0D63B